MTASIDPAATFSLRAACIYLVLLQCADHGDLHALLLKGGETILKCFVAV
jgi:hypothetical protein